MPYGEGTDTPHGLSYSKKLQRHEEGVEAQRINDCFMSGGSEGEGRDSMSVSFLFSLQKVIGDSL